jgi:hypothetical protein
MDTEDEAESQEALLELRTKKEYIFGSITRSITMGKESRGRVINRLNNGIGNHAGDNGSAGIVTATPDCRAQDGRQRHIARTNSIGQVVMVILRRTLVICLLTRKGRRESNKISEKGREDEISELSSFSTLFFSEQVCEFCVCFHHMRAKWAPVKLKIT